MRCVHPGLFLVSAERKQDGEVGVRWHANGVVDVAGLGWNSGYKQSLPKWDVATRYR